GRPSPGTPRPGSSKSTTTPASGRCGPSPSAARTTCSPGATRAGGRPPSSTRRSAPAGGSGSTRSGIRETLSAGCRPSRWHASTTSSPTGGRPGGAGRHDGAGPKTPRPLFRSRGTPTQAILIVMADVTQLLDAIEAGDPHAAAELLPLVYAELRKLAAARLA